MRKRKSARIVFQYACAAANLLLARLVSRPVVLCFHRLKTPSGAFLDQRVGATDPRSFRRLIGYLRVLGYRFVSLEKLVDGLTGGRLERVAVITFDDGFKDLYRTAHPFLKELGLPYALFLAASTIESKRLLWLHRLYVAVDRLSPSERVGVLEAHVPSPSGGGGLDAIIDSLVQSKATSCAEKAEIVSEIARAAELDSEEERRIAEELYLTRTELSEMQEQGLGLETHGSKHWPLTCLDRAETEQEIQDSISLIKRELATTPRFYGLPYGIGNPFVKDIVAGLGLKGIVTIEARPVRASDDPFALPRIMVRDDIPEFYERLAGGFVRALLEGIRPARR